MPNHTATGVVELERLVTDLVRPELEDAAGTLDPDRTFTDLGLDSTGVIAVAGGLEDALGVEVVTDLFFDHPTIARLAEHLAGVIAAR